MNFYLFILDHLKCVIPSIRHLLTYKDRFTSYDFSCNTSSGAFWQFNCLSSMFKIFNYDMEIGHNGSKLMFCLFYKWLNLFVYSTLQRWFVCPSVSACNLIMKLIRLCKCATLRASQYFEMYFCRSANFTRILNVPYIFQ